MDPTCPSLPRFPAKRIWNVCEHSSTLGNVPPQAVWAVQGVLSSNGYQPEEQQLAVAPVWVTREEWGRLEH